MSTVILAQIIGFVGVICFIFSFQIKSNKMLFLLQLIGSMMFCVQFLMLGAISGCYSLLALLVRNGMLIKFKEWAWVRWKGWIGVLTLVYTAILIITWDGFTSLLPFIAMTGGTVGYWTNNAQTIRLANLVCVSPAWLLYDALVGAWAGVLNELIVLGSIFVSIYRYGWKAMGDPDSEF